MKVKLNNELGIVIKPEFKTEWDNEPGLIRWDTDKDEDLEDWRGLFASFLNAGGREVSQDTSFEFITDSGHRKR